MTKRQFHTAAWAILAGLSVALHLWELDARSFHSDEAIHAHTAYKLLHEGAYRYDPTYHGPLLYYLTVASYALFGDSDFTARLPIALCGILMLVAAARFRRPFGRRAAWWTALLLTISPTLLYYSRFLRMDLLELLTATAALLCFYEALTRPSSRTWIWLGAWTAFAFATKENAYVTAFLVLLVLIVLGAYQGWKVVFPDVRRWIVKHRVGLATAVAVLVLVVLPLYTVFLRYPEDWLFPFKAIEYWVGQHKIERVAGPWWYYLPRLALYEFLPLVAASIWVWRRRRRLRAVEAFLYLFGIASLGMYAYLGEKVPWLAVHQIWAFMPLAGAQLARTFGPRGRSWSRALAAIGLMATFATALTANFVLEEITPARRRVEALIYVQTTPEFRDLAKTGLELVRQGREQPIAAVEGIGAWPLSWYWRHLPVWWSTVRKDVRPPLVITDVEKGREIQQLLGTSYRRKIVPLRAWWIMEAKRPTLIEITRYVFGRMPWGKVGASRVLLLQKISPLDKFSRPVVTPLALATALPVAETRILGEGWLVEPRGIAVAGERLVVADAGMSQIVAFTADGRPQPIELLNQFREPEDVAWSPSGTLYIADTWNHRVIALDPQTLASHTILDPSIKLYGPRSVAVHRDGRVAVADTGHKRLILFEPKFGHVRILGGAGDAPGKLDEPVGVTWVGDRLLIADTGNNRLQLLDTNGKVQRIVPLSGAWPDYYSRPQVVAIQDDLWLATDPPNSTLWLVRGPQVSAIRFATEGIRPAGLGWDATTKTLYMSDLVGRLWQMRLKVD